MIYSRQGLLHFEANRLDAARACFEQSIALSDQLGLPALQSVVHGLAAPLWGVEGHPEGALDALRTAAHSIERSGMSDADYFLAMEINLRLRLGDAAFAADWAAQTGMSLASPIEYAFIETRLSYARLLLAQNRLSDALAWLARVEAFAVERELNRILITVRILQALACERQHDGTSARAHLSEAVMLAASNDYQRAFIDDDARVLLPAVRQADPRLVDAILNAPGVRPAARRIEGIVEPISERELEVLRLIADGLSNAEIAERLFIAVGTVKRHINHLYGKLAVRSRTQVLAKAREVGLL